MSNPSPNDDPGNFLQALFVAAVPRLVFRG